MSTTDHVPQQHTTQLDITGMTCASCANRIEKKLRRVDQDVQASVNLAMERADVRYPESVSTDDLVQAVRAAGYDASVHQRTSASRAQATGATPGEHVHGGHDHGDSDSSDQARRRLLIVWVLAAPVIVLGMVPALQFVGWQWLSLALAVPVVLWGGWQFHRTAFTGLRHGATTMDTLVSIGTLAALGWSLYALFFGGAGHLGMRHGFSLTVHPGEGADSIYLEAAAGVTAFLLTGRYLEGRSKRAAGAALRALAGMGAKDALLLHDGVQHRVPVEQVRVGDLFVVPSGEKIPTDGEVTDGSSAIDNSAMTGESVPVEVGPGAAVTGGAVNAGGRLIVRATRVGEDTSLAQLGRLVEQAQAGKAQVQRLADRVSAVFVPVVMGLAVLTFVGWWALDGSIGSAFTAAVGVLVIAGPCALGLATPTALLVGSGRGAQLGLLIKGPEVLENTRTVDTVLLDKTGTLTTGRMSVDTVIAADGESRDRVLAVAAALEDTSSHPIARAVAQAAPGPRPAVGEVRDLPGLGVTGRVDDMDALVGRPALLIDRGLEVPRSIGEQIEVAGRSGRSVVAVGWDGRVRGLVLIADRVKPGAAQAVRDLRRLGLRPVLLTGDNAAAAQAVAAEVGIEQVVADVLPDQKAAQVRDQQAQGRVVAMVGDGVNDAAALAQADLGIAMGTGADVAIEAGDLTIVSGDVRGAADAIRLSRRTLQIIKQNLVWAFAYNVAAIPLAMSGRLGPMVAGLAMAFSSVFVVLNSLRLRSFSVHR